MLQALVPILLSAGVPIAQKLISRAIGEDMAELADPVIHAVAAELGIQPTVENIVEQHKLMPRTVEAAFQVAERENAPDWQGIIAEVNATMRAEHNARGLLTRIWRPLFGLLFGVVFAAMGAAMIYIMVTDENSSAALAQNAGLLIAWISAGAAVVGVYVHKRSEDKRLGVG